MVAPDLSRFDGNSDLDASGFPGATAAAYKLEPSVFERHLDAIAARGLTPGWLTPSGILPAVALTFDDGGASAMDIAAMLERRGWRGHFLVTTGRIGSAGFLTADEVRELVERGHVIGSHSHTHPVPFGRLADDVIADEWQRSRDVLAALLGAPPELAGVPGGALSKVVITAARDAGYRVLMTSEPTTRVDRRGWSDGRRAVHGLGVDVARSGRSARRRGAAGNDPGVARLEREEDRQAVAPSAYRKVREVVRGGRAKR